MTNIVLTKTETSVLQAAAANEGRLQLDAAMKPASRTRLLGRLMRDNLIAAADGEDGQHRLTAAGYRALGLTPPKKQSAAKGASRTAAASDHDGGARSPSAAAAGSAVEAAGAATAAALNKKAQVLALLAREEGATLPELISATGWLPHTVRAALSRVRSGGQTLVKTPRPDGTLAYRIAVAVATPRKRRPARTGLASAPPAQVSEVSGTAA